MKLFNVVREGMYENSFISYHPGNNSFIGIIFPLTWKRNKNHNCYDDFFEFPCKKLVRKWLGIKIYLPKFCLTEQHY